VRREASTSTTEQTIVPLEAVTAGYFGVVPARPPTSWLDDRYAGASLLSLDRELVAMVPGPAWTTSALDLDLLNVGVPASEVHAATAWLDEAWRRGCEAGAPSPHPPPQHPANIH
jgi:hypothetical protein